MIVTLRYGKLSDGTRLPCAYALERSDGTSALYQSDYEWPDLVRSLGGHIPDDDHSVEDEIYLAVRWLDRRLDQDYVLDDADWTDCDFS